MTSNHHDSSWGPHYNDASTFAIWTSLILPSTIFHALWIRYPPPFHFSPFCTPVHRFAQRFNSNLIDAANRKYYLAHRLNREA